MLRKLYDQTLSLAGSPYAIWWLALVSFAESSVFPIPPDALMIPMIVARPDKAWLIAGVTLAASVLGGILGYAIGAFAYDSVGAPILLALGKDQAMSEFAARFNEHGFWAVLVAGLTPFPYKVITIMSGFTRMDFAIFLATSVLARGLRFFAVAGLLRAFGEPIRDAIERRLGLAFTLFVALLAGGFLLAGRL